MKIVNTLLNQADDINLCLTEFVQQFKTLSLAQRFDRSTIIFAKLSDFFQQQDAIITYTFKHNPHYQSRFKTFETAHSELLDIYEHTILLHVQEDRYRDAIQLLHDKFKIYLDVHYEELMCQIQADFTEQDEARILNQLKSVAMV